MLFRAPRFSTHSLKDCFSEITKPHLDLGLRTVPDFYYFFKDLIFFLYLIVY